MQDVFGEQHFPQARGQRFECDPDTTDPAGQRGARQGGAQEPEKIARWKLLINETVEIDA